MLFKVGQQRRAIFTQCKTCWQQQAKSNQHLKQDVLHFNAQIKKLLFAGKMVEARQKFEQGKSENLPDVATYSMIIRNEFLNNEKQAMVLLEEMKHAGIEPNSYTYTGIIEGLCKKKRIDQALEYLQKMKQNNGIYPTTVTYNVLIASAAKQEHMDIKLIDSLFDELKQRPRLVPDVNTYGSLIHAYAKSGAKDKVLNLIDEMQEKYQIELTTPIVNAIVDGLVKSNQVHSAHTVLSILKQVKPELLLDATTYTPLLNGMIKMKMEKEALSLFESLKNEIVLDMHVYNFLLHAYVRQHSMDKAEQLFQSISGIGNSYTYSILIRGHADSGSFARALELYEQLKQKHAHVPANIFVQNAILKCYCRLKQMDKAQALFHSMEKQGNALKPDKISHVLLVKGYLGANMLKEAEEWIQKLELQGMCDAHLYNVFVAHCVSQKLFSLANKYRKKLAQQIRTEEAVRAWFCLDTKNIVIIETWFL